MALGLRLVLTGLLPGRWLARTLTAPAPARSRRPGPALRWGLTVVSLALIGLGLVLIARVSLAAEVAVALGLIGLWALARFLDTERATRRAMARRYARFRRTYPTEPEITVLLRTLTSRYPGWTNEQLVSVVLEYPTLGALTRAVIARDKLGISPEELVGLHRFVTDVLRETGAGPGQMGPTLPNA